MRKLAVLILATFFALSSYGQKAKKIFGANDTLTVTTSLCGDGMMLREALVCAKQCNLKTWTKGDKTIVAVNAGDKFCKTADGWKKISGTKQATTENKNTTPIVVATFNVIRNPHVKSTNSKTKASSTSVAPQHSSKKISKVATTKTTTVKKHSNKKNNAAAHDAALNSKIASMEKKSVSTTSNNNNTNEAGNGNVEVEIVNNQMAVQDSIPPVESPLAYSVPITYIDIVPGGHPTRKMFLERLDEAVEKGEFQLRPGVREILERVSDTNLLSINSRKKYRVEFITVYDLTHEILATVQEIDTARKNMGFQFCTKEEVSELRRTYRHQPEGQYVWAFFTPTEYIKTDTTLSVNILTLQREGGTNFVGSCEWNTKWKFAGNDLLAILVPIPPNYIPDKSDNESYQEKNNTSIIDTAAH